MATHGTRNHKIVKQDYGVIGMTSTSLNVSTYESAGIGIVSNERDSLYNSCIKLIN